MKRLLLAISITFVSIAFSQTIASFPPIPAAEAVTAWPSPSGASSSGPPNGGFRAPATVVVGPSNYDFENGTTDWTSGSALPGGQSGNYLKLSNATSDSTAFTVTSAATTFAYYTNTDVGTGGYAKLFVAEGPSYSTWIQKDAVLLPPPVRP